MSDTPRTDEVVKFIRDQLNAETYLSVGDLPYYVLDLMWKKCCELERELAAAQAWNEASKDQLLRASEWSTLANERAKRIAELERDGGVGYGLTPDDLDRPPYNFERKDRK